MTGYTDVVDAMVARAIRSRPEIERANSYDPEFRAAMEGMRGFLDIALSSRPYKVQGDLDPVEAQEWVDRMVQRVYYDTQRAVMLRNMQEAP